MLRKPFSGGREYVPVWRQCERAVRSRRGGRQAGAQMDDRGGARLGTRQEAPQPKEMELMASRAHYHYRPMFGQLLGELQSDRNAGAALARTVEPSTQRGRQHDRARWGSLTEM